jgi:hypothetical protein
VSATAGEASGGESGAVGCRDFCAPGTPACCSPELRCVEQVPSCRIDVLSERVGVAYDYAELEQKIASVSAEVLVTIADTDIDWAAADAPPAARIELHLSRTASKANVDALTGADSRPFRVTCDGQPLFVGVVYLIYGAAALQTPVLHVGDIENDALVLRLGAWQGAWLLPDAEGDPQLRERLDRSELRATFCARGVLSVLEPP